MHRNVEHAAVPDGRTVVQFTFEAVQPRVRDWWLVITPTEADVCDTDPGHDIAVLVRTELRCMIDIWRGTRTWLAALRSGEVRIDGPEALRRALPTWFRASPFAAVQRPTASVHSG
jgi:hypothetical protein